MSQQRAQAHLQQPIRRGPVWALPRMKKTLTTLSRQSLRQTWHPHLRKRSLNRNQTIPYPQSPSYNQTSSSLDVSHAANPIYLPRNLKPHHQNSTIQTTPTTSTSPVSSFAIKQQCPPSYTTTSKPNIIPLTNSPRSPKPRSSTTKPSAIPTISSWGGTCTATKPKGRSSQSTAAAPA